MTDEEKAKELTIKNVTDGKNKYFSWGFYKGCVVGLEYNNKQIVELKKENAELKEKLDKIRKYLVYDIFDRFKYLENLLKISQETQEELSKRILEQQKTIGSLTDTIDELKVHCKAVDKVNEKMKCCGNCGFAIHNRLDGTFCDREADLATIAYMHGAERYKTKWHKVADNDYPPCEKGNYSINILTDRGDIAYYNYDMECWIAEPSSAEINPPVAWCEIPKYEE